MNAPTVWFVQTVFTNWLPRHSAEKNYLNIESHARAFLVFYCTNYLHELTAEALGYKVTLI